MKHGTGLLISLITSLLIVACAATIWHLSSTAEFSRKASPPPPAKPRTTTPPKTNPNTPTPFKTTPGTTTPPKAKPAVPSL